MDNIININPFIAEKQYLKLLKGDSERKLYKLCGEIEPIYVGYTTDNRKFIQIWKCNNIVEKEPLPNNKDLIVEKIEYNQNIGSYLIELR